MVSETHRTYEPISLSPADGCRAIYLCKHKDGTLGCSDKPLIAWAVYEVSAPPVTGSSVGSEGRKILGVVLADGHTQCAEEVANFWHYLAPGEPEPSPANIAAEHDKREQDDPLGR